MVDEILETIIPALCDQYAGDDAAVGSAEWFVQQSAGNLRNAAQLLYASLLDLREEQQR